MDAYVLYGLSLIQSSTIATAKSVGPKFQSGEEEKFGDRVKFCELHAL